MERIALRHYRLVSRAPYVEVGADQLVLRLPMFFGQHLWTVPLSDVAVVRRRSIWRVAPRAQQQRSDGRRFVEPVLVPFLPTTSPNVDPNLQLLFRTRQRVPPVRWTSAINSDLPFWASRSAHGAWVDGVALRAVNGGDALRTLLAHDLELIIAPTLWLSEHRAAN